MSWRRGTELSNQRAVSTGRRLPLLDVSASDLATVLAPEYREQLRELSLDEIRVRKVTCQHLEEALSYLRRIVQGRHDIARAELDRRATGGSPRTLGELVEALPDILAGGFGVVAPASETPKEGAAPAGVATGRMPDLTHAPDPSRIPGAEALFNELKAIAGPSRLEGLTDVDADAVQDMVEDLYDLEQVVSTRRRSLHRQLKAINNEMIRRYQTGEATVDALLS